MFGVYLESNPFLEAIDTYKRHFDDETLRKEDLFRFKDYLKEFIHVIFIHPKDKPIPFKNVPPHTRLVDMISNPDAEIAELDRSIREGTRGLFEKFPADLEFQLRSSWFRSMVLALFYMKVNWDARDDGRRVFHNHTGQMVTVPFVKLEDKRVRFSDNRIFVTVPYRTETDLPDTYVVFSKACNEWAEERRYATVHLPKLNLSLHQEYPISTFGKVVMKFKYVQDENGFESTAMPSSSAVGGGSDHIYFDEPFEIKVFARDVKVFQILVLELERNYR